MADPTPNRPLWQVMEDAHREEAGCVEDALGRIVLSEPDRFTRAAEIRVVADWLVPEEGDPSGIQTSAGKLRDLEAWNKWEQRQATRKSLLAEADRAEAGE